MNTGNRSELEKEVEDVKLLVESLEYQKDEPSQQQQALSALGEILSHNSEFIFNVSEYARIWRKFLYIKLN